MKRSRRTIDWPRPVWGFRNHRNRWCVKDACVNAMNRTPNLRRLGAHAACFTGQWASCTDQDLAKLGNLGCTEPMTTKLRWKVGRPDTTYSPMEQQSRQTRRTGLDTVTVGIIWPRREVGPDRVISRNRYNGFRPCVSSLGGVQALALDESLNCPASPVTCLALSACWSADRSRLLTL